MKTRTFGPTNISVPVVGIGTWNMEHDSPSDVDRALRTAIELGLRHIDTAELYGSGRVEELVGKSIQNLRKQTFLVSKVVPSNASYAGTIKACERSLRRLNTDYLDGYLLHWPGPHPLEETFRAFEELISSGKIRFFGVSNFDVVELNQALKIAGPNRIACNQVYYHLGERGIENELLPIMKKNNVAMVGYSPFNQGNFPVPTSSEGRVLYALAEKRKTSPYMLALNYLTKEEGTFTIPKTCKETRVREYANAFAFTLAPEELEELDRAFPRGRKRPLATI